MSGLELPTLLAIGSAAVGAIGTVVEAGASASAARHQADVANYNAQVSRNQAEYTVRVAAENERRFREDAARRMGAARAAIGASGIGLEGSPLDVLSDSAAAVELDARTIRAQGQVDAANMNTQAQLDDAAATGYRSQASSALFGGLFGAGTTLLGSAIRIGNNKSGTTAASRFREPLTGRIAGPV